MRILNDWKNPLWIIMNELDDLGTYNADTEHDMWVDFDRYENTGTPDVLDGDNLDEYIDNLKDWDWHNLS